MLGKPHKLFLKCSFYAYCLQALLNCSHFNTAIKKQKKSAGATVERSHKYLYFVGINSARTIWPSWLTELTGETCHLKAPPVFILPTPADTYQNTALTTA